jgi:hypothetical protein
LRFCGGEGCYLSKRALHLNVWYHVAVTYSLVKGVLRLYIDGSFDEYKIQTPISQNNYPLVLGGSATPPIQNVW